MHFALGRLWAGTCCFGLRFGSRLSIRRFDETRTKSEDFPQLLGLAVGWPGPVWPKAPTGLVLTTEPVPGGQGLHDCLIARTGERHLHRPASGFPMCIFHLWTRFCLPEILRSGSLFWGNRTRYSMCHRQKSCFCSCRQIGGLG